MRIWRLKGLRNLHKLMESRVRQRARTQTHNWFLLNIDVILENRGGLGFSKEDGAAIKALDSWPCIQPNTVDCQALIGETWYSLFLLHYFWIIFSQILPKGHLKFSSACASVKGNSIIREMPSPQCFPNFHTYRNHPRELIKTQVLGADWDPEILHF